MNMNINETICGTIKSIIFQSKESGFTIASFETQNKDRINITGDLGNIYVDQKITVGGTWKTHPKFGKQLSVKNFKIADPSSKKGISLYLSSGRIKGIGKGAAELLVNAFGEETLNVIENDPDRLTTIKGIGKKKADVIIKGCKEFKYVEKIMVWLHSQNISATFANRIYNVYGKNAISQVKKEPYELIRNVDGIAFLRADEIAKSVGIEPTSTKRIHAGLTFTLKESHRIEGQMYLPENVLTKKTSKILKIDESIIIRTLNTIKNGTDEFSNDFVEENGNIYMTYALSNENKLAANLKRINNSRKPLLPNNQIHELENFLNAQNPKLSDKQIDCIIKILTIGGIHIISGPAGTGKTLSTTQLLQYINNFLPKFSFEIACPTGRASQNITEITKLPSQTIHRLLKYNPANKDFVFNEDNKLSTDFVMVDETSMLDTQMARKLTDAISDGTTVVFVGDPHQLPSVGAGNVLQELIQSHVFPNYYFSQIFRQEEASDIIKAAHDVLNGKYPKISNTSKQCRFIHRDTNEGIVGAIKNIINKKPEYDIQVLSPMRKGEVGVTLLNQIIEPISNKYGMKIKDTKYHIGDKIIQNKNHYNMETIGGPMNVFNGDIGVIEEYNNDENDAVFSGKIRGNNFIYHNSDLPECDLAYAITIHKSQGSEFENVILPVTRSHFIMLSRNLLYTAITRASKKLCIIGTPQAIMIAIRNNKAINRYTKLAEKLSIS